MAIAEGPTADELPAPADSNINPQAIATLRIETPAEEAYFVHGGILPDVLGTC